MGFSYFEAISYLYNSTNYENFASYRYERFEQELSEFREFLDNQEFLRDLPVAVHIAGSKGKGSVAFLLEKYLLNAKNDGKHVFPLAFTSPHLLTLMERIRFAGQNLASEIFAHLLNVLVPQFEEFQAIGRKMTFFEMMMTLYLKASQYYMPDALIVETGLGGRLDATNVFAPEISVITTIEREHTRLLGSSIEQIAFEKAGILKKGQIFVLAPQIYREATQVLLEQAKIKQVKKIINLADTQFNSIVEFTELVVNAVLHELAGLTKFEFPDRIYNYFPPARQEKLNFRGIEVIVDSAHTMNSIKALTKSLSPEETKNSVLVIGLNVDKHDISLLREIPACQHVITCSFESARCLSPLVLAESLISLYPEKTIEVSPNTDTAFWHAVRLYKQKSLRKIIVTGSVYLAGEIYKIMAT